MDNINWITYLTWGLCIIGIVVYYYLKNKKGKGRKMVKSKIKNIKKPFKKEGKKRAVIDYDKEEEEAEFVRFQGDKYFIDEERESFYKVLSGKRVYASLPNYVYDDVFGREEEEDDYEDDEFDEDDDYYN